MEGSMKCIKYLLFGFNLLFALTGLILIITGGVIKAGYNEYLDFLGNDFFNTPIILIVVGCFIFLVTFFGCSGAIKEHHCMTLTFSIFLSLIFLVEFGAGIGAYMLRSDVRHVIEVHMEKGLQHYDRKGYEGVTNTWNVVQHELKCCGAQEYEDWENTTFSQASNSVPDSCCFSDVEGCGNGILTQPEDEIEKIIHTSGCLDKLEEVVSSNIATIGGVGVGIALIQFVGIVFACLLARSIKKEYETV